MTEQPDLMSALKASLDAVKARDEHSPVEPSGDQKGKLLNAVGEVSSESAKLDLLRAPVQAEMTPAQALDHRYAAEAGRRADALRAFRSCLHLASEAEGNGEQDVADDHRADAINTLKRYPDMLVAIETAVGKTIR
jgi:hypothetical protein